MMQLHFPQPSWHEHNPMDSYLDESCLHGLDMDVHMSDWELSSSFNSTEDLADVSSMLYFPNMNLDEVLLPLPCLSDNVSFIFHPEQDSPSSEEFGSPSHNQEMSDDIDDVFGWIEGSENNLLLQQNSTEEEHEGSLSSPSEVSSSIISAQASLVLPREDMEVDNQLSVTHLLKAYGEAMTHKQAELAEVISTRLKEMAGPIGLSMERLAYYLTQDKQIDYLKQESMKNYEAAFRAFYQVTPYGRFAHLTANLAILQAIPEEAEKIHIIDFDLGDGVQWSSLIEAIGQRRTMRLTSIKWKDDCEDIPQWKFDDTKRRLYSHAQSVGLNLEVDEMEIEELVRQIKKIHRQREWLAFNCMVNLPHMGRKRSRRHVAEFLKAAKESINSSNINNTQKGITILGNGDGAEERKKNFDGYLVQCQAMFESIGWHLASHLTEAKIAMECLFLAPYVSSISSFGKLEENTAGTCPQFSGYGLEGCRISRENMEQAKEIVKEGGNSYRVKVEGVNQNMLSLEWRGTTLVRVSSWT